jgi:hypothetical protein
VATSHIGWYAQSTKPFSFEVSVAAVILVYFARLLLQKEGLPKGVLEKLKQ